MRIFAVLLLACSVGLVSCKAPRKFHEQKTSAKTAKKTPEKPAEESSDVDFQAFVGRLRKAVASHDVATLKTMMTDDFGYRLSPEASGSGVFQYWEDQGLWPELQGILSEKFVKKGDFMVAPPQFASPALNYDGYRAGIRRVNGSWKFAYFVNG
ncbi:MAG TPA: hypothetical protein VIW07_12845 [Candidatus Udaeobacter sp.]|jgi:hypothetical protein